MRLVPPIPAEIWNHLASVQNLGNEVKLEIRLLVSHMYIWRDLEQRTSASFSAPEKTSLLFGRVFLIPVSKYVLKSQALLRGYVAP